MPRKEKEPDAFETFLLKGKKGQSFTYFVGRTVVDFSGQRVPEARLAFRAYEDGLVNLVQRRVPKSDGLFEYIAQRR